MSSFLDTRITRRHLMAAAGTSLLTSSIPALAKTPPPPDVGYKFWGSRRPMPFAGNTFLGHLEQQGDGYDSFDRVLNIYRELPEQRFANKFALLPPSSYHVTLLGGVNESDRAHGPWPSDLERDHALADINADYLLRVKERATPPLGACRFLVNPTAAKTGANNNLLIPLKTGGHTNRAAPGNCTPGADATDTLAAPRLHQLPVSYFAGLPCAIRSMQQNKRRIARRWAAGSHGWQQRGRSQCRVSIFLYVRRHVCISHDA